MGEKPWERSCYECQSVESTYPCPLKNCTKHSLKEEIKWTHSNCGGYLRLYDNGKEKVGMRIYFVFGIITVILIIKIQIFQHLK